MPKKIHITYAVEDLYLAESLRDEFTSYDVEVVSIANSGLMDWRESTEPKHAMADADAVLFLVTNSSVNSPWLFLDLGAAEALGKPIIPLIHKLSFADVPAPLSRYQFIQLDQVRMVVEHLDEHIQRSIRYLEERESNSAPKIFVSYAHEDKEWLSQIKTHLKVLQHEGIQLEVWDDTRIRPGSSWKEEIETALAASVIGIVIISTDFLASDFVVSNELPELLLKARDEGLTILPLIVRPCRYTKHRSLSKIQAVNDPSKPLISLEEYEREEILVSLADAVEDRIKG